MLGGTWGAPPLTPGEDKGPEAQFSGLARPGSFRAVLRLGCVPVWIWGPWGKSASPCLRARFEEGNPFTSQPSLPRLKTVGERLLNLFPEALRRELTPSRGWGPGAGTLFLSQLYMQREGLHAAETNADAHTEAGVGRSFSHRPPHRPHSRAPAWPLASGQTCSYSQALWTDRVRE